MDESTRPPLTFYRHAFTEPLFLDAPEAYVQIWLDDNWSFFVAALFGLIVLAGVGWIKSPWRLVPPGPIGLPFIGNIFALQDQRWLFEPDCRNKHGDMIYLNILGKPILILNTQEAAADLLDRRANIYSDRPRLIMANEILTGSNSFTFSNYGDRWRRMRRAAHEGLGPNTAKDFHDVQRREAVILASDLLANPNARNAHMRRATASTILSVIYDFPSIKSEDDPDLMKIDHHIDRHAKAAAPGAHLVEIFTWMSYLPSWLAKWKREGEEWYRRDSAMFEAMVNRVQANLDDGVDRASLTASLLKDKERAGLSDRERAWLTGGMYAAGAETTSSALLWWTLAMVAYPETQRRAQAELDAVVGRSRLPTFADLPHLPYIRAMVKEVLRWRPTTPLGVPHQSTEDDWYRGFFIPKGTIVFANIFQCNNDTEIYGADARVFNPARHLDEHGNVTIGPVETKEEGHVMYGFGRRICVGRHVANNSLAIDLATVLWAANFEAGKGVSGKPLPLDVDNSVEVGLINRPVPFTCTITPRFPEASAMLADEREALVQ
ncbi:cytochrome P450 [Auriscalpium vulgare]|uniref:Cytochrome P450 n=1 Tax=Auriscalpium vulgare TaxID=40419 RepID=A0ACB8S6T5_9AGAM|nr:cytochrome P450 [Auriscalpium vulgare]